MTVKRKIGMAFKQIMAALFLIIMMMPFVLVLINAFKPRIAIIKDPLGLPMADVLSASNFIKAWTTMDFGKVLLNTVYITGVSQAILIIFGSMLSYMLLRWNWKINKYIFAILICAMIIPFNP